MAGEFWLWAAIETLFPKGQPRALCVDDRRELSGIVHVLKPGCRWQDCPCIYGPPTTVYNRFNMRNLVERAFRSLKDWRRIATHYDKLAANFADRHQSRPIILGSLIEAQA